MANSTKHRFFIFFILFLFCFQSFSSSIHRISPTDTTITGEVVGIILSFHSGHSYDELFTLHTQKTKDGAVVLTYMADSSSERFIVEALNGNYQNSDSSMRQFIGQVNILSQKCSNCIVFNWECSSGFSSSSFAQRGKNVFALMDIIIKRGFFAMFSDFSLKALIKEWNSDVLGVNPFVQVGETGTPIQLRFNKNQLLRSSSTQLQAAAQLSQDNLLTVNVLGGTITYGVDSSVNLTDKYTLEVLTIASNFRAPSPKLQSSIDHFSGLAGHVLLSYKEGGKLLTSMGHWIQLMKIETSEQKLFQTSQKYYGSGKKREMEAEYNNLKTKEQKIQFLSFSSKMIVQQQMPGSNLMIITETEPSDL